MAINSLEDENNEYRAVFAVDKLNEGWDVLNLFDIVRLYDTKDGQKGKPGKTIIAEAQLIGRGARYCPFISGEQPLFKRKYDEDLKNELRICEELHYHSSYNPQYIRELNSDLVSIGIKENNSFPMEINMKPVFKQTRFYNAGFIYINDRLQVKKESAFKEGADLKFHIKLRTGYSHTINAFDFATSPNLKKAQKEFNLKELGQPVIRKAINRLNFYRFSNLQAFFPKLQSISEFINSEEYFRPCPSNDFWNQ